VVRPLLNSQLYFPSRTIAADPAAAGLPFADLRFETVDGERLHGWWVPARGRRDGHVLLCHGNAGNIGDRVAHARLLADAGFDVLAFDYRGYGRSDGRPSEEGTYRDAHAAREALLLQPGVDPARVFYLGESLGGGISLDLALEFPPAGLILQSAFTSVRDMARLHYPFVPAPLVPDAYPSVRRIGRLRAPVLVMHGERDDVVPVHHGRALFAAAPEPKHIHVFPDAGHDLVSATGPRWARVLAAWASRKPSRQRPA
jgi:alpha-beta hydrolase superfamily lysophospholipase